MVQKKPTGGSSRGDIEPLASGFREAGLLETRDTDANRRVIHVRNAKVVANGS